MNHELIHDLVQWGPIIVLAINAYRLTDRIKDGAMEKQRLIDKIDWNEREIQELKRSKESHSERIFSTLEKLQGEVSKLRSELTGDIGSIKVKIASLEANGCKPANE